MLLNSNISLQAYGDLETPWRFLRNQLVLRCKSKNKQTKVNKKVLATTGFPETADIETSSEDYASRFAGEIGAWFLKVQEEATLKMLAPYPNAKVLDVGGGHGQITGTLIKNGYQVTVVGSDDICKARIKNFIDANLCKFKVGNVLDLPYPKETFDVVISYRFLAHVTQWQSFLTELNRVAKQAVIVDYPTVRSVNAIAPYLFKFKKGLEGNTREFICYKEHELLKFFKSIGLSKAERYPQFFAPMVLHRALKSPGLSSFMENLYQLLGLTYLFGSPVILKLVKN
ncbi:MAG: class I SAM-dependent methyltransferase [Symploca sp. SIO3C6]|uniref:Class I SAM-dependent methyltransferase n=1 Tax=Symploca sp. SIO1C4 TaxID=2607765 RepID=A0A6B3N8X9_9CYAN|nr:class I SAM-dependent methyltransferase [Symploca sp. SIO3C6]NER27325.1 class I SAM-dependent methyltransferase [Symploca sp. SIO1C4]